MRKRWMWLCLCGLLACGERKKEVSTVTVSGQVMKDSLVLTGGVKVNLRSRVIQPALGGPLHWLPGFFYPVPFTQQDRNDARALQSFAPAPRGRL